GGGRRSGSVGSNSSSRLSEPVKSSIGLMSLNASARPLSRNHWKESRWIATRSGSGRASSMLAKEKRSGLLDRAGNGLLLPVVLDRVTCGYSSGVQRCGYSSVIFVNVGSTTTAGAVEGRRGARHSA